MATLKNPVFWGCAVFGTVILGVLFFVGGG